MIGEFDRRLLERLQRGLALEAHPFAQIAEELGVDESQVLQRTAALREAGIIREIAGVFAPAALGFRSALVAMTIPPDRLDSVGAVLADHPGISHAYARRGAFNLWFTLATGPDDSPGLADAASELARRCNAERHIVLTSRKRYKLRPPTGQTNEDVRPHVPPATPIELDDLQQRVGAALQQDLPATHDAFAQIAGAAGLDRDELLRVARAFQQQGLLRRYAALLDHRRVGCRANVLVAWDVPENIADRIGKQCAEYDPVSHCILRDKAPGWNYNLYTMIHGRSDQDCAMTIDEIAAVTGISRRAELPTVKEYVKRRARYF